MERCRSEHGLALSIINGDQEVDRIGRPKFGHFGLCFKFFLCIRNKFTSIDLLLILLPCSTSHLETKGSAMVSQEIDFSIIIPAHDRPDQLKAALRALTQIDYSRRCFEVIIVDDGSVTPLADVVKPFVDSLQITLLQQVNRGPAAARNVGAARARGKYLAFTDDDSAPAPCWLRALSDILSLFPDCLAGGRTVNALVGNVYSTVSQLLIDYLYSYFNTDTAKARFFTSNNIAMSRQLFLSIGGFDETFPQAAAEDREFCDRWLCHGRRMIHAPGAIVYHAHPLTMRSFFRQHWSYGRGAFHFWHLHSRRIGGGFRVEHWAFYRDLLFFAFSRVHGRWKCLVAPLLVLTQVANTLGFVREYIRRV